MINNVRTPFPGRRRNRQEPSRGQVVEAEQFVQEAEKPMISEPVDPLTCSLCGRKFADRRGMHFHTRRCRG